MTGPTTAARMPNAIAGAVLLQAGLAALAAVLFYSTFTAAHPDQTIYGAYLVCVVAFAATAVGSWRGWIVGQAFGVILGVLLAAGGLYLASVPNLAVRLLGLDRLGFAGLVVGALLVTLLVVPQSSRDWFNYKH